MEVEMNTFEMSLLSNGDIVIEMSDDVSKVSTRIPKDEIQELVDVIVSMSGNVTIADPSRN